MAGPVVIETDQLKEFSELPEDRKKLIAATLSEAKKNLNLRYHFGGAKPESGGFDCSGAIYYALQKSGLKPPRTSA